MDCIEPLNLLGADLRALDELAERRPLVRQNIGKSRRIRIDQTDTYPFLLGVSRHH